MSTPERPEEEAERLLELSAEIYSACMGPEHCRNYPLHERCRGCLLRALLSEQRALRAQVKFEHDKRLQNFRDATRAIARAEAAETEQLRLREALKDAHICEHAGTPGECQRIALTPPGSSAPKT